MTPLQAIGDVFDSVWEGLVTFVIVVGAIGVAFWFLLWVVFPSQQNLDTALSEAMTFLVVPVEVVIIGLGTLGALAFVVAYLRRRTSF